MTGIGLKFSADFIQVPESKFGIKLVSSRSIKYAHMIGILMHVWTINDEEKMRSLIELGVDGIMTDECRKLKAVLEKKHLAIGAIVLRLNMKLVEAKI